MAENNNNINSYAGFTIGPIYEVLSSARKTRELWFASYIFSWFMEKMIEELSRNSNIKFLLPYVDNPFKPNNSITGKYHDRFIFQSYLDKNNLFDEIQKASNDTSNFIVDVIDELVKEVGAKYLNNTDKNSIRDILKSYIQRNFVVFDAQSFGTSNIINFINGYLDSMEENRFFDTGILDRTCFICKALPAVIETNIWVKKKRTRSDTNPEEKPEPHFLCPLCFLKFHSLKSGQVKEKIRENNFRYPTILDISAVELLTDKVKAENPIFSDSEKDYEFKDIEETAKKVCTNDKYTENHLLKKLYFKYFAIIQADGDNLGKVIGARTNFNGIVHFSKSLFDFANKAEEIITTYKGYPIYICGDDILAFVPVAFKEENGNTKTVIDLAINLSNKYNELVDKGILGTSLSIGINIAYYKFPLSLALKNARMQLFDVAKKVDGKNALALLLTKHSGHQICFKFQFGSNDINNFSDILRKTLAEEINFPHSLHHNLSRFKTVIANIPDENRLKAFFENNFNEPEHKDFKRGIDIVMKYFEEVLFNTSCIKKDYCIEDILSKLAFIKFLRGEK